MAGCLSASLLKYGNQSQWIANQEEEYLEIAQTLFANGPRNKKDRVRLRQEMQRSPVGDAQRLSQELESLYRNCSSMLLRHSTKNILNGVH